jgi:hypothetical protein
MEIILIVALGIEGFLLYLGQRKIFFLSLNASNRFIAYLFAAPGTILHELSHYLLCKILLVETGRVSLFRPRQQEDGGITLGFVEHAKVDPLRGVLISIAPLLLVPPLLLLITVILFGSAVIDQPIQEITSASLWKIILWLYLSLSAGQGAFPSVGDHIGVLGGLCLIVLAAGIFIIIPQEKLFGAAQILVLVLALPALASLLSLTILQSIVNKNNQPIKFE